MNFLATIALLVVCIASIVSSTAIREKRQYGYNPYGFGRYGGGGFGRPYGGYGGGPYGGGYGGGFRRGPTVIEKTVIIRG
ncbi:Neuropeptide-like protein 29 family protein [Ostertagia ostertagi]